MRRVPVRVLGSLTAAVSLVAVLSACSPTVAVEAAPNAAAPECAEVSVTLPAQIGEFDYRETSAQGAAAWGPGPVVLLRCGLEPVEVSDDVCITIGGVDWLIDESGAPYYRFTSYGREPSVEVIVDYEQLSGTTAVNSVSDAVNSLPTTGRQCVAAEDATIVPSDDAD